MLQLCGPKVTRHFVYLIGGVRLTLSFSVLIIGGGVAGVQVASAAKTTCPCARCVKYDFSKAASWVESDRVLFNKRNFLKTSLFPYEALERSGAYGGEHRFFS